MDQRRPRTLNLLKLNARPSFPPQSATPLAWARLLLGLLLSSGLLGLDLSLGFTLTPALAILQWFLEADVPPEPEEKPWAPNLNRSIEAAMLGTVLSMLTFLRQHRTTKGLGAPLAFLLALGALRLGRYA